MKAALVNSQNVVENIIAYDPEAEYEPEGFTVVELPDESMVTMGSTYNPSTKVFTVPVPDPSDSDPVADVSAPQLAQALIDKGVIDSSDLSSDENS